MTLQRSSANGASMTGALRRILHSGELHFALEAHDGMSARIVERAGFGCLWASGFALSTVSGVRDANELSWTDIVRMTEAIADAVAVPVLVDGDTGHGDFNIARRFVRKLELAGAAGVCLEDKLFPKTNSFVGDDHALADVEEFSAKIRACKANQATPGFCIVARTEALIAGLPLEEALARAEAYRAAGADAVMVHSRAPVADDILCFAREWQQRLPLVISPTTYCDTPAEAFRSVGISLAIWGNHAMRAAAAAIDRVAREIHRRESVNDLDTPLARLDEVFDLIGYDELEDARASYGRPAEVAPS
jgi:phosphoenolpyruvate phosphomutase